MKTKAKAKSKIWSNLSIYKQPNDANIPSTPLTVTSLMFIISPVKVVPIPIINRITKSIGRLQ